MIIRGENYIDYFKPEKKGESVSPGGLFWPPKNIVVATGVEARIAEMLLKLVVGHQTRSDWQEDDNPASFRYVYPFSAVIQTGKIVGGYIQTKGFSGHRHFHKAKICAEPIDGSRYQGGVRIEINMILSGRDGDWSPETWPLVSLLKKSDAAATEIEKKIEEAIRQQESDHDE